jgi:hypothetical protein
MKHCNKCDQDKPLDAFSKTNSYCKQCFNAIQNAYRAAHKDSFNAQQRARYRDDPEYRKRQNAYDKKKLAKKKLTKVEV